MIENIEKVIDTLEIANENIYNLALSMGYKEEQAKELQVLHKQIHKTEKAYTQYLKKRDKITIGRLLPVGVVLTLQEWDTHTKEEKEKMLWDAGVDVYRYSYVVDILCTTFNNRRFCGLALFGQERTDRGWLDKIVDGVRVASLEAQLLGCGDPSLIKEISKLGVKS